MERRGCRCLGRFITFTNTLKDVAKCFRTCFNVFMNLNRHALRDFRRVRGLTITQLANQVETSQSHISNIEAGRRVPSGELIQAFSDALGVDVLSITSPVKVAA